MVDQDVQAALGVTSYQGRWVLILDSGGAGSHTVPGGKTVWRSWAPDSLVLQYLWGKWAPQHTFPKFCLFAFVIREIDPDIRQCGGAGPHTVNRKQ